MTTNQTIDGVLVSCELLKVALGYPNNCDEMIAKIKAKEELRALLDAKRCDSCDDSGDLIDLTGEWRGYCVCPIGVALKNKPPHGEPVALLSKGFTTLESGDGKYRIITQYKNRDDAWSDYTALCRADQPAPVAVVLPDRDSLQDIIAQAIGGDAYDCVRVWSAWGVGTMSEDDFIQIVDQE